jgi:hypothetical protein
MLSKMAGTTRRRRPYQSEMCPTVKRLTTTPSA